MEAQDDVFKVSAKTRMNLDPRALQQVVSRALGYFFPRTLLDLRINLKERAREKKKNRRGKFGEGAAHYLLVETDPRGPAASFPLLLLNSTQKKKRVKHRYPASKKTRKEVAFICCCC